MENLVLEEHCLWDIDTHPYTQKLKLFHLKIHLKQSLPLFLQAKC